MQWLCQPRVQRVKKMFVHLCSRTFGKRQQVRSKDTASMCDGQTGNQRQSDTYREDDTSTLPPTPLHDHTSSLPCRVPGTSSMHAGCHSRRMTSFSSTMPFPLLTLNCHTPLLHAFPACRALLLLGPDWDSHTHTHTHTHTQTTRAHTYSYMHTHTRTNIHASLFLSVIYTQWETAQPVTIIPLTCSGRLFSQAKWVSLPDWIHTVMLKVTPLDLTTQQQTLVITLGLQTFLLNNKRTFFIKFFINSINAV